MSTRKVEAELINVIDELRALGAYHTQRLFGIGILGALGDLEGAKALVNS